MTTDLSSSSTAALLQSVAGLSASSKALERMLDDFFAAMAERGMGAPIMLKKTIERSQSDLQAVRSSSERVMDELQQLQELLRTLTLLTSSLELDQVLDGVMDTVVTLTGAERAYLMLYTQEGGFSTRAARNWDREDIDSTDVKFSRSVVNLAIKQGEAIITDNAQTDERFGQMNSILVQQLRSILCIPLLIRGRVVGVLYADNRFQYGIFKRELLPLLTAFGTQAAIAIENARVYGDVRDGLAKAEREISRLRIEIDEAKREREVKAIVESRSFSELRARAEAMRERRQKKLNELPK